MTTVTIFTPAYNRARTLPRLFDSLLEQGTTDIEWLVVDDGSTDHTSEVVENCARRSPFAVRYHYQQNAGKHAATNTGVELARGELFWTVDSDDWLVAGAVARMLEIWDEHNQGGRTGIAALTGLCVSPSGSVLGESFPSAVVLSNSLEMRFVHRVAGDKAGWTRTDVLRQHPFPVGDYNFIPEGIVWNAIAREFQTLYVNEPVLVKDYQADGFTRGGAKVDSRGMALYHASLINDAAPYLAENRPALLRSAASYSRFARASGASWAQLLGELRLIRMRALVVALAPVGWWLRRTDSRDAAR